MFANTSLKKQTSSNYCVCFGFLFFAALSHLLTAGTIYVNHASTGTDDGASWVNAYLDLQDALSVATDGDQIWVAQGVYKPDSGINRYVSFEVGKGVSLYGGFFGSETQLSERNSDPESNGTILSGDLNNDDTIDFGNRDDNSSSVIKVILGSDSSTVIDGFTITSGKAIYGGGVNCATGTSPTIRQCQLKDNIASQGGAVYLSSAGSPSFSDCIFKDNQSGSSGGAAYIYSSQPVFTNCQFLNNQCPGSGGNGGAVHNSSSDSSFTRCEFSKNLSNHMAGALYISGSTMVLDDCSFSENTSDNDGGAIFVDNLTNVITITDTTFTNNSARWKGGAIYFSSFSECIFERCVFTKNSTIDGGALALNDQCHVILTDSTFTENSATTNGGAIIMLDDSPRLSLTQCAFHANSAKYGGAVYDFFGSNSPAFNDCTFTSNSATIAGGAIMASGLESRPLNRCVFISNAAQQSGGAISIYNSTLTDCGFMGNSCQNGDGGAVDGSGPTFLNCAFSGNSTTYGDGGAVKVSGFSTFTNCSLSGNSCRTRGGAIYGEYMTMKNCIIWNNRSKTRSPFHPESSIYGGENFYNCLIQNFRNTAFAPPSSSNLDGTNRANNPLFLNPPNPEMAPTAAGDLRLRNGSPVLDVGINSANPTPSDLAGNTRIQNTRIDLGAYEGGYETSFAILFPDLEPFEDENGNGVSNFADYASGGDPTISYSQNGTPAINGTQLTFFQRINATDVIPVFSKSRTLSLWEPMVVDIDYTIYSQSGNGYQQVIVLDLMGAPSPATPSMYFRQEFQVAP